MQDSLFLTSRVCSTLLILIPCDKLLAMDVSHIQSCYIIYEICGNGQESLQVSSVYHCISSLHHCSTHTNLSPGTKAMTQTVQQTVTSEVLSCNTFSLTQEYAVCMLGHLTLLIHPVIKHSLTASN
jgi:hypothetical protein